MESLGFRFEESELKNNRFSYQLHKLHQEI